MKKNAQRLWLSIAGGIVFLFLLLGTVFFWKNSAAAQKASQDFVARLSAGEWTALKLSCYPTPQKSLSERKESLLTDQNQNAVAQLVTKQELANIYGEELALAGADGKEQERLFALLMQHSQLTAKTGLTLGKKSSVLLTLNGPNLSEWLEALSDKEQTELFLAEDKMSVLEEKLKKNELPMRVIRLKIPMLRQNDRWKFSVTEEQERILYGLRE